jgi:hypothetical protein
MKLLQFVLGALTLGVMQEAEGSQSSGGSTEGSTEKRKRAPKTNLLDIVRGRMPLPLVAAIRFVVKSDVSNAEVAKIFGTSVGKVFDIRKGRNFEYVTKDYKPGESDLAEAKKWAAEAMKHGGDEAKILAAVEQLGTASPEEAKAQAEKITAARSKGPRQPKAKSTEGGGQAEAKTAAELLK